MQPHSFVVSNCITITQALGLPTLPPHTDGSRLSTSLAVPLWHINKDNLLPDIPSLTVISAVSGYFGHILHVLLHCDASIYSLTIHILSSALRPRMKIGLVALFDMRHKGSDDSGKVSVLDWTLGHISAWESILSSSSLKTVDNASSDMSKRWPALSTSKSGGDCINGKVKISIGCGLLWCLITWCWELKGDGIGFNTL